MRALFWLQEEPVWSHVKRLSECLNDPTRQPQGSCPSCALCSKEASQVGLTNLKVCCKKPAIGCLNGMLKELQQWAHQQHHRSGRRSRGYMLAASAHTCNILMSNTHPFCRTGAPGYVNNGIHSFCSNVIVFQLYLKFYFRLYIFLDMYFRHLYIFFLLVQWQ